LVIRIIKIEVKPSLHFKRLWQFLYGCGTLALNTAGRREAEAVQLKFLRPVSFWTISSKRDKLCPPKVARKRVDSSGGHDMGGGHHNFPFSPIQSLRHIFTSLFSNKYTQI
jgi:hypothetical protein